MAMSKKCFIFALCVVIAIVVGVVIFVVIQTKSNGEDPNENDATEEKSFIQEDEVKMDAGKAEMMCESIVNGTEPHLGAYNHPSMFHATLGINGISVRVVTDPDTSDTYQKNSYWLTADQFSDKEVISMIRADACRGKVPVIVISMRPSKGIKLSRTVQMWNHYKPKPLLETWEDYDKKLNSYLKYLSLIPALVILEPDLLMFTYDTHNLQYGWLNDKYKEEFYQRAQKVIKVMSRSWIYVDAGNSAYLKVRENMENMAKSLLRLDGLRGFSVNTAHFFNASYNNMMARRLHCLTGLHYITDTSRNGGPFSRQDVSGIEKCYFDPPRVLQGMPPGWSWGTRLTPRQKRWIPLVPQNNQQRPQHAQQQAQTPATTDIIQMPNSENPPDRQQNPEAYNQWINSVRNNAANSQNSGSALDAPQPGSVPQPQPNNYQPNQHNSNNMNNRMNGNDLSIPTGRVPIRAVTPAPTRPTFRQVTLRTTEEAQAIYRKKAAQRVLCLRKGAVSIHDASVWIKTPGEADGRLYAWGTYHKCLLGHNKECAEECRLITHNEQRSSACSCEQNIDANRNTNQQSSQNQNPNSNPSGGQQSNGGIFFSGSSGNSNTPNNNGNSNQNQNSDPGNPPPPNHSSLEDLLSQGR